MSDTAKWQPIVLVLTKGERLECSCGALAIFVVLELTEEEEQHKEFDYGAYCQSCWHKAQEDEE